MLELNSQVDSKLFFERLKGTLRSIQLKRHGFRNLNEDPLLHKCQEPCRAESGP